MNRAEALRIESQVDPRGRRAVELLLGDAVCRSVDYRFSTPSTNSLALSESLGDESEAGSLPKLFVADEQTRGRGRHGRRWLSCESTLTFSLVVTRTPTRRSSFHLAPLAVGVGIARFLEFEFAPLQVRLKWPNDIHAGGGKVAGILIETSSARPDRMIIGVGVNVGRSPELDSKTETQAARGLADVLGRNLERYDLLYGLVTHVLGALGDTDGRAAEVVDEFRQRCLLSGRVVSFREGDREYEGLCQGISQHGSLVVRSASGVREIHSGEANLVRAKK